MVTAEEKHFLLHLKYSISKYFFEGIKISPVYFFRANKHILQANLMQRLHGEMFSSAFYRGNCHR